MRFRTIALAAGISAGLIQTGDAFAPRKKIEQPVVAAGRNLRSHRDVAYTAPKHVADRFPGWRVIWDHDTDVPLRMWGPNVIVANAVASPTAAEAAARRFLADNLDILAPGASIGDFQLVANQLGGANDIRTVAFEQYANGLRVLGGSVGFAFKHDHLSLISSTALPNVTVKMPTRTLDAGTVGDRAAAWVNGAHQRPMAVRSTGGTRTIVPLVYGRGRAGVQIDYRVAEVASVEAQGEAGRWDVFIDAQDGTPIARQSTLRFATGQVEYNVPDRYPLSTRGPKPAPFADVTVNGTSVTSAIDGTVTWVGEAASTIVPGLSGTYAAITNQANGGTLVTASLSLAPNGATDWDESADANSDAQLDAYVFENTVKQFVLTRINPNLGWALKQEDVFVNENMTCNAYSTGDDIHFFIAGSDGGDNCENTGRIADVVYHESGHSVHFNSIIPGQGVFDSSLSEGLADTMSVSITGDPGVARGFFLNDTPLRNLAPAVPKVWPKDADGEPHDEGEIIGETLWDSRVALQAKLGDTAGFNQFLLVYYSVMQRSADIPSTYPEALLGDDDDGDLTNGTPDECELAIAFSTHGLFSATSATVSRDNYDVSLTQNIPATLTGCALPGIVSAELDWTVRGGTGGAVPLTASGSTFAGTIPTPSDGSVIDYSIKATMSSSATVVYPQNPANPIYEFYVGAVTPLQCFDFESGFEGWTHTATPSTSDEWQVGPPLGVGGDPAAAHGGSNVLGIDLGSDDGDYGDSATQYAESPEIDLQGHAAVRLQYWRWLGVEDGAYDQATILANGKAQWTNLASPGQPQSADEVNFIDQEWQFQDVDLAAAVSGQTTVKLRYSLISDGGVHLGGWTIDDVCLVTTDPAPPSCGNGVVDNGEECDDGNTTSGDGCSSSCQLETGNKGGGCCSSTNSPSGAMLIAFGTLGIVLRRRRARR